MARLLPLLSAIVIVVLSGLVHGHWSHRASDVKEVKAAASRLNLLATTIGDWSGRPSRFDERGLDRAGILGLVARRYENRRTGGAVTVLVVCGRPGPIAVHGPEICYAGAGYDQVTPIVARVLGGGEFWMSHFRQEGPVESPLLRIYWAWSGGDRWKAAESPRLKYAEKHVLYKIYMICNVNESEVRDEEDSCRAFAEELLTELQRVVTPSP